MVEGGYGAAVGETRPEEPGVLIVPRARIYDLVSGLRTPRRAPQLHRCIIRGRTDGSTRLRADLLQKPLASRGASTDEYTPFCSGPDEVKSPEETGRLDLEQTLDQIKPPNGLSYATILEEWTNDWNGFFAKLVSVFKVTRDFYEDAEEWLLL